MLPVIVIGHLALCYLCVRSMSNAFYFSRRVILLHVLSVAGVMAALLAAVAYALHRRWLADDRTGRSVVSLAAAVATTGLAFLYLLDLIGNYFWGDNLNYQVAWQYASMALPNRTPFFIGWWVYVVAAGMAALLFALYWSASAVVLTSLRSALDLVDRLGPVQRTAALGVAGLLVLTYGSAMAVSARSLRHSGRLNDEPVIGFFMKSSSLLDFSQYAGQQTHPGDGPAVRATYPRNQSFTKKNVIIIIADSLRADHMGVYGYQRPTTPFLNRLFVSGRLKRVELALSTCAETNCGILSTLVSRPMAHLAPHDFSLDQLLHDNGYSVYRILSGNHDWRGLREAFGNEQTLYFDGTNSQRFTVNDDRLLFEGLDHVPDYHGTPAFFQFHLMSGHLTGVKHDAYRRYQPSQVRRNFQWGITGDDRQALTNNYDNGVLEADATIGDLFERLNQKGYLANSICVVMSDHGEGLGERGPLAVAHTHALYQEYIHIPLLIYDEPGVTYRNLSLARQIDIAPTIIDRLGLVQPSSWEGHSLLDDAIPQYSYHESGGQWLAGSERWHGCYAVIDVLDRAIYKYLRCGDPLNEELYDLAADQLETHDLSREIPAVLMDDLRGRLREYLLGNVSGQSESPAGERDR